MSRAPSAHPSAMHAVRAMGAAYTGSFIGTANEVRDEA